MRVEQEAWIIVAVVGMIVQLVWERYLWPNALEAGTSWPVVPVVRERERVEIISIATLVDDLMRERLDRWRRGVSRPEGRGV